MCDFVMTLCVIGRSLGRGVIVRFLWRLSWLVDLEYQVWSWDIKCDFARFPSSFQSYKYLHIFRLPPLSFFLLHPPSNSSNHHLPSYFFLLWSLNSGLPFIHLPTLASIMSISHRLQVFQHACSHFLSLPSLSMFALFTSLPLVLFLISFILTLHIGFWMVIFNHTLVTLTNILDTLTSNPSSLALTIFQVPPTDQSRFFSAWLLADLFLCSCFPDFAILSPRRRCTTCSPAICFYTNWVCLKTTLPS